MVRTRLLPLSLLALVAALLFLPVAPAAADGLQIGNGATPTAAPGVTGTSYRSPSYGYTLTWDPSWQAPTARSANGEDLLVLSNGVSTVSFDAYAGDGGNPATCLQQTARRLSTTQGVGGFALAHGTDGQPLEGSEAGRAYAVYTFTVASNGTPANDAGYLDCRTLVPGQAVLAIFQVAPLAAFNTQVQLGQALLANLRLPAATAAGPAQATALPTAPAGTGAATGGALSATDCAGMAGWAAATTQRLDRVDAIGDAYNRAISALGQGQLDTFLAFFAAEATEFAQLAAAQRQGPVPPAAEINEELASAFSTISSSLTRMQITLSAASVDMYALNQATQQIELAANTLKQDRPRVEQLVTACGGSGSPTTGQPTFRPGQTVVVTHDQTIVRSSPGTGASLVESLNRGAVLRVIGQAVPGDGGNWWPVVDPATNLQGYVAAQDLAPAPAA